MRNRHKGTVVWFTGISAPYEAPEAAELVVDTGTMTLEDSLDMIADYVEGNVVL